MILTGLKLQEIGRHLYGAEWASVLASRLRMSKKTVFRWRDSERAIPPKLRDQLSELIDDQLATLAAHAQELREGVMDEP